MFLLFRVNGVGVLGIYTGHVLNEALYVFLCVSSLIFSLIFFLFLTGRDGQPVPPVGAKHGGGVRSPVRRVLPQQRPVRANPGQPVLQLRASREGLGHGGPGKFSVCSTINSVRTAVVLSAWPSLDEVVGIV